jgi:phage shock protein C
MIFGVCAGIANEMNIDPTVMRLIFAVATLMGFGLPILIYIVMAIVMK